MILIYALALMIHIALCVVTWFGIKSDFFDVHDYMFYVVVFLPFWGFLAVLVLHFEVFIRLDGRKKIQMKKMRIDSEIYKGVTVDDNKNSDTVVPIEEALLINDSKERRQLIMDVLNDNPKEYIEFLQKAGNNEDTEVVHYAVTAMVEISKENDYKLQQLDKRYNESPDDFEIIKEYCDFLWSCLEQKLMQGQVEVMNRNFFNELVAKKLQIKETEVDYVRLIKNCLKLKLYTEAGDAINKMKSFAPDSEELMLMQIEYYAAIDDGDAIKEIIHNAKADNRYLSSKAKEVIAFWEE